MTKRLKYLIEIDVSDDAYFSEVSEYIKTAVEGWSKGGDPDSALWDTRIVSVKRLPE